MTVFDLWPNPEWVTSILNIFHAILNPPMNDPESDMHFESESVLESDMHFESKSENDLENSYWEQVQSDVCCGKTTIDTLQINSQTYYPCEQPKVDWAYGPLIATTEGKRLLDATLTTDLQWKRLDRLNRFIVLDSKGETIHNVRSIDELIQLEPTIAPHIAKWYTAPWYRSKRSVLETRQELTERCPGLQHLADNQDYEEVGQHHHAPPTFILSAPAPKCNWRTQELVCQQTKHGWLILRTMFESPNNESEFGTVYFYVSLCIADPHSLDMTGKFVETWMTQVFALTFHKLEYLFEQKVLDETFTPEFRVTNQWMLLRLTY